MTLTNSQRRAMFAKSGIKGSVALLNKEENVLLNRIRVKEGQIDSLTDNVLKIQDEQTRRLLEEEDIFGNIARQHRPNLMPKEASRR